MDLNISSSLTMHPMDVRPLAHLAVGSEGRADVISHVRGVSRLDRFVGCSDYPWVLDYISLSELKRFPDPALPAVATTWGVSQGTHPQGQRTGILNSLGERGFVVSSTTDTNDREG
jgi:hypothetical protein